MNKKERISLSIHTSSTTMVAAEVRVGDKLFAGQTTLSTTRKSQEILPLILRVLTDAGCALNDITHVYIDTGPGSFTGTRVGMTVAQTLAFVLGVSLNDSDPKNIELAYTHSKWDS